MKKQLKKQLAFFLSMALIFSMFSFYGSAVAAESTNPAPSDTYFHTTTDGLDYLKATEVSYNNIDADSAVVGDILSDYLAYGATKGVSFTHTTDGSGFFAFYSNSNKVVRTGLMPADLSAYDGIRFYLAVNNIQKDADTGLLKDSLPTYLSVQLVDESGNGIADAKIEIYSSATAESKHSFKDWVYLEPDDFTLVSKVVGSDGKTYDKVSETKLTSFPKEAYSFEIRWRNKNDNICPAYGQYDIYKDFEVYFSGLSYYTKNAVNTTNPERNDNYVHTALNGLQTLSSSDVYGVTTETGVTANVAYGSTNALKASFTKDKGTEHFYAYSSSKVIPNNTMPSTLSQYDGISMFLTLEDTAFAETGKDDSLPQYLEFILIDSNCKKLAEAWIPIYKGENARDKQFYQGWVYLEPSDFYAVSYNEEDAEINPTESSEKLTAFPDAATFAIGSRKVNNDAQYDIYKYFNVYISGLSAYQKPVNSAATDKYVHTKIDGFEKLTTTNDFSPRGSIVSITGMPKVTVAEHVAYGSPNAFRIAYKKSSDGWSQFAFYGSNTSGTKREPYDTIPSNLASYDGIRMFLSVDSSATLSTEKITIALCTSYGVEKASSIITMDMLNNNKGWIYLTPASFGLTAFDNSYTRFVIKTAGTIAYDVYLSGMSAYVNTDIAEIRSVLLGEATENTVRHELNGDTDINIRDLVWLYKYTK